MSCDFKQHSAHLNPYPIKETVNIFLLSIIEIHHLKTNDENYSCDDQYPSSHRHFFPPICSARPLTQLHGQLHPRVRQQAVQLLLVLRELLQHILGDLLDAAHLVVLDLLTQRRGGHLEDARDAPEQKHFPTIHARLAVREALLVVVEAFPAVLALGQQS